MSACMLTCKLVREESAPSFFYLLSFFPDYFPVVFFFEEGLLEWILDRWGVLQFLQVSELCWSCRWTETVQPPTPPSWASRASTWRRVTMSSSLKKVRNIRKAANTSSCHGSDLFASCRRRRGESERPRRRQHQGELQGAGHLSAHR